MFSIALVLALASTTTITPFSFVQTYVGQLAAMEDARQKAVEDLAAKDADPILSCVKSSEDQILLLRRDIAQHVGVKISSELADVTDTPNLVSGLFQQKLALYQQLSGMCTKFAAGPKPGVDYQGMIPEVAKIRSRLEFVEKGQLEMATLVFFSLIRKNPDAEGHMSHLSITKKQKTDLIRQIELSFGDKLDKYPMMPAVAAMSIYRNKLGEYKGSDEP